MKSQIDRGALDLLEESIHLLRRMPMRILFLHFVGSFPYLLGLLYFLADMSRGPFAHRYVAEAAVGISLLYIWMKCWQSAFCGRMYSHLLGREPERLFFRRIIRVGIKQAIIQPYGLILIPVAFLILLPFGWTFAFFQNVLVIGSRDQWAPRKVTQTCWRLAMLWPAQNHRMLLVFFLFTMFVWMNIAILFLMAPSLLQSLFGVETIFSLSGFHLLNTTFLAVVTAFTYLAVQPLLMIVYTLRCFYGEAIDSGADLIVDLQAMRKAS